MSLIWH